MVGQGPSADLHAGFEPFAQASRLPMQNDPFKKRAAQEHDKPVPIHGDALAGGGDVVKIFHAITEAAPDGLKAKEKIKNSLVP